MMNFTAYHKSLEHLHVGCERPRAYFIPFQSDNLAKENIRDSSSYFINLSGDWNFRFYDSFENIPEDIIFESRPDDNVETIKVPINWQMLTKRAYDKPLYSNLKYPFPLDPPHVPDENPCAVYSREFTLPGFYSEREIFINFEGVSSAFYVWINGIFAGYSQVSHCTSELNISEYSNIGINNIVVLVVKWCDGSYLEDQDFFRLSGIFRDIYILGRAKVRIIDVFIKPLLNENMTRAEIDIETLLSTLCKINYKFIAPGGEKVCEGTSDSPDFSLTLNDPILWNDEEPKLYSLFLTVSDEHVLLKIGFRKLCISEGVFRLNGKAVKCRGINRHDSNPVLGYTTPLEHMMNDLYILKQSNCNAIRTSHYPNDPRFLNLCDELGFMVINEADLETHGMGYNSDTDWDWFRWSQLSNIPEWREAYVDRAARLFERDKNHVCVIMWSLGNESGIGENHRQMATYIRARDENSFIHYENAHIEFRAFPPNDRYEDISDVESRMYADIEYIENYLEDRTHKKPFFLCEYVDAMTTGDVYAYWELIRKYDNFFGGCIWEMADHAVCVNDKKGGNKYFYGGDFGDYPNDGICCLDGLLYSNRSPRPGLLDMKHVYQQYNSTLEDDFSVTIESYRYFKNLDDTGLNWKVACDGLAVCEGTVDRLDIKPQKKKNFRLFNPDEVNLVGECYLTLSFFTRTNLSWAQPGFETGFEQFKIDTPAPISINQSRQPLYVEEGSRYIKIIIGDSVFTFDKSYGVVCSIADDKNEMLEEPIKFKLWRAPAYNEGGMAKIWRDAGLDHIKQKTYSCYIAGTSENQFHIVVNMSLGGPSVLPVITGTVKYSFYSSGDMVIGIDAKVNETAPPLPRIGLELVMTCEYKKMEFFGYGPQETYVDRYKAARKERYSMNVGDNFEHYIRPQENSSHYGTLWAIISDSAGHGLFFSGYEMPEFSFNSSNYTAEMLTNAKHDFELVPLQKTVVNLDWRINSMSGNPQIAAIEPKRILNDKQLCYSFRIKPVYKDRIDPFEVLRENIYDVYTGS